ncbi:MULTISPECIES: PH domain-containing protein [Actinomycetaceae]|uniref:PH domain-containing protein n=1 Tax=Schaalia turicensis TaxID=131111 RepID=A0ABZ0RFD3_9ACTO|nr:PH domain-containing protein [Actinotignum sanguinis]WPJ89908.1 PH domain-containing protein [Schaalia turicensis]MDK8513522.1 PH domain-containing protein [Actinotignum sanguinis]MDK8519461.1 PH domain-containing protein [Actinotignum sanguinis]MDK8748346.1 PH domain-containing protein [Actinotignum sanguinis]MDV2437495.1 PH domain-containing protein [Actinotignum sanguinis]
MELAPLATWIFSREIPIPPDVENILVEGEEPYAAYKAARDSAIFTSKRLIVRDAQGLTGKKVEIYSLPYSSIKMWSTKNAGYLDISAEIKLWTMAGHIGISLDEKIDVRRIDQLIARCVLGAR